jgi:hypothetical protein
MFACIDGEERETAPPSELALHPSNVVSLMVTFSVEVELNRLHCAVENATKRASIAREPWSIWQRSQRENDEGG